MSPPPRFRTIWLPALDTVAVLLALNLLSRNLGTLGPEHARLYGLLALLALLLIRLPWPLQLASPRALLAGVGAWLLALAALYASPPVELWLAALPLLIYGLDRLLAGLGGGLPGRLVYLYATLLYALLWLACQTIPALWLGVQAINLGWSRFIGRWLVEQPLSLGPSATGFWIFAGFACYLLARTALAPAKPRAALAGLGAALVLLLGLEALYLWLQNQPDLFSQRAGPLFNSQYLYFLLGLGVVLWPAPDAAPAPSRAGGRVWLLPALAAAYALALALYPLSVRDGERSVYLLDDGFVDWDKPVFGKYGPYETGMFGSLPDHLQALGYRPRVGAELSSQSLTGADVLVVINPTRDWSRDELQAVWSFVTGGGALLVLGDHTDIAGSKRSLDRLLRPVNIAFFYDSAYPGKPGWRDSLAFHLHPVTLGVERATEAVISVGASLDIAVPAFPVVVGRYGFSDLGNMLNVQGAFLGNYSYEKGEQLGDVVLTAGAFLGDGKVLVFGDTSPFQNTAMAFSLTFVHNVFEWLTARHWNRGGHLTLAALLLLALGYGLLRRRPTATVTAACALALSAGLGLALVVNQARWPTPQPQGPLALVDRSHGNRLSLVPWKPTPSAACSPICCATIICPC